MKLIKKILIGLLILVVLLLILAFFLPREMNITATGKVDAPAKYAYNILNDFKHQSKWDPWLKLDTTMIFAFSENSMGEGAYVDYKSNSYGEGRTTRVKSTGNEQIKLEAKSDNGDATMQYDLKTDGDQTDVSWNFKTEMPFPLNLMNFFFQRSMKNEMENGISNISKLANDRWKKGLYNGFEVKQEVIEERNYIINRDVVSMEKINDFYTRSFASLFQKIQASGVELDGRSSGLVYNHNIKTNELDIAAALPIKEAVAIAGAETQSLEAGRIVSIDYYGNPDNTPAAHAAIDDYMRDRGLLFDYPVVEEYVTDPTEEKDPEKWLTQIRYYLAN